VGLIGPSQRPAKQDSGQEEASGMEKREQMKVPMESRTIPCHQGVKDAGYLPEPEDTDAQDPVQPGHSRKPA